MTTVQKIVQEYEQLSIAMAILQTRNEAAEAMCEYAGHKSHCEMLADVITTKRLECTCGLQAKRNKWRSLRGD